VIWIKIFFFSFFSAGEEARLRLPGALRRGAAGPRFALHLHLPARVEGTPAFTMIHSDFDFFS